MSVTKQVVSVDPSEKGSLDVLKHIRSSEDFEQKNLLQKGFTLVELLVVIVILGILAAVVVFAVGGTTDNAQDKACKAERSTVEAAVEAYKASTGDYPTNESNLVNGDAKFLRSTPTYYTVSGSDVTGNGKCENK
jgi:general secretion pathway protein G